MIAYLCERAYPTVAHATVGSRFVLNRKADEQKERDSKKHSSVASTSVPILVLALTSLNNGLRPGSVNQLTTSQPQVVCGQCFITVTQKAN